MSDLKIMKQNMQWNATGNAVSPSIEALKEEDVPYLSPEQYQSEIDQLSATLAEKEEEIKFIRAALREILNILNPYNHTGFDSVS